MWHAGLMMTMPCQHAWTDNVWCSCPAGLASWWYVRIFNAAHV